MKRACYNVTVRLKEPIRGIDTHSYSNYYKVRCKMKGDNAKIWFYYPNGDVTIEEFSNVASVEVRKIKK